MYDVKVISLKGDNFLKTKCKVGDVISVSDEKIGWMKPYVKILRHYRLESVVTGKCDKCGGETRKSIIVNLPMK